jgi:hypothetical protein
MNRQASIGLLAVLAAGTLGFYLQPGASRRGENEFGAEANTQKLEVATRSVGTGSDKALACDDLVRTLGLFLAVERRSVPRADSCQAPGSSKSDQQHRSKNGPEGLPGFDLRFVIATLPDPIHTHLALMFDRMAEVIQQASQDENYSYEASWLPWDDKERTYPLLMDEDKASDREELTENQPGILLFRDSRFENNKELSGNGSNQFSENANPLFPYRHGLVVFVVGEDATSGIHIGQFTNALDWIDKLRNRQDAGEARVAILGPTFSGSFPSLAKLLLDGKSEKYLNSIRGSSPTLLSIYSGTANSGPAINRFLDILKPTADAQSKSNELQIGFHGFLERDEVALDRFCRYLKNEGYRPDVIAVISEDETAYGGGDGSELPTTNYEQMKSDNQEQFFESSSSECLNGKDNGAHGGALHLNYPRDISTLRAAYQTNAIFNAAAAQQPPNTAPGRLPSDLADPEGEERDTIRSYGGNQTPLSQEAYLLGLANALRTHHIEYLILRSTNVFDQLFLARFLRKAYPDARIVTDNSDRLFEREGGTTGMGGMMSLSTYPLLSREQEWIHGNVAPRLFNSDASEGTYIAMRMLLRTPTLRQEPPAESNKPCLAMASGSVPVATVSPDCSEDAPTVDETIPDYGNPQWMVPVGCKAGAGSSQCDAYHRPAIWVSVIARDGYWPVAALNGIRFSADVSDADRYPFNIPLSFKLGLLLMGIFCSFHLWCCSKASFTAKPAFRAHFAGPQGLRHTVLLSLGSLTAGILPLLVGWGYGVFDPAAMPQQRWWVGFIVVVEAALALAGSAVNIKRLETLSATKHQKSETGGRSFSSGRLLTLVYAGFAGAIILLFLTVVYPTSRWLGPANRSFACYRSMHLFSGISPIVPLLALAVGVYIWFWNSLHGLALFGQDRCKLPPRDALKLNDANVMNVLCMYSQEMAADGTEAGAKPLADAYVFGLVSFVSLLAVSAAVYREWIPVRTLGPMYFAGAFFVCLSACISIMLAETWQFLRTWTRLRALLMFLDRTALRRTLAALRGFSWGTVWGMSGNVLDVRYKLLSRQLESLGHTLSALNQEHNAVGCAECVEALKDAHNKGREFAKWYAENYAENDAGDLTTLECFQDSIAGTAGILLVRLLVPEWIREKNSLILEETTPNKEKEEDHHKTPLSEKQYIRDAEEFVCLPYLGFIQNVLGRMRSIAMSILWLFVATSLAISSYPFDPRQGLGGAMLVLFLLLGAVILYVYVQMHKDATLSHVTNTIPGELGSDFWLKLLSFGFVPLVGLLTTIFPQVADFLFSWVQPGIQAMQ